MAYMISCECINCSACEYECPVRAIAPGPSQFTIDAGVCVECDGYFPLPRCVYACPVNACAPARESYLVKMRSLASRGAAPLRLTPVQTQTSP
ncbi:MAG: ferredoxin [Betaproteobacteria bacterium]|nr:ferredoxin [Betaproteobacteria bacterium]